MSLSFSYDLAVFIGRFQPLHAGHEHVARRMRLLAPHHLILVGSAHESPSFYNPFSWEQRARWWQSLCPDFTVLEVEDSVYNVSDWVRRVQEQVQAVWKSLRAKHVHLPEVPRVVLVGHDKDATTYYLRLFPTWAYQDITPSVTYCASDLRVPLFGGSVPEALLVNEPFSTVLPYLRRSALDWLERSSTHAMLSSVVRSDLAMWVNSSAYERLAEDAMVRRQTQHAWSSAPYAPIFVTADLVVVRDGKVLLIRRKHAPGKGLWALPGGFVNADESVSRAAVRELQEETGWSLTQEQGRSLAATHTVFDEPRRSVRGRVITHAFYVAADGWDEPVLVAGDDAEAMQWCLLAELPREKMFEDHYKIVHHMHEKNAKL